MAGHRRIWVSAGEPVHFARMPCLARGTVYGEAESPHQVHRDEGKRGRVCPIGASRPNDSQDGRRVVSRGDASTHPGRSRSSGDCPAKICVSENQIQLGAAVMNCLKYQLNGPSLPRLLCEFERNVLSTLTTAGRVFGRVSDVDWQTGHSSLASFLAVPDTHALSRSCRRSSVRF